jgi:galactan 5-O-arabinofuranosyltransferase
MTALGTHGATATQLIEPARSGSPARFDLITGRRLARAAAEMLLSIVVAALGSLAVQWVLGRVWMPQDTFAPAALATLCYAVLLAATLALLASRRWPWWSTAGSWLIMSLVNTVAMATMLMSTRYYLGGVVVDQQFRMEYLTRMTDSAKLADFAYPDIPSYYPAGWFWLGGRFANLFHLPAWAAYKPWAILTLSVAGVLAFVLWSLVTDRRKALLLSMVSTLIGLLLGAVEPYAWLASATMVPLLVIAWRMLTALRVGQAGPDNRTRSTLVLLGVALGAYGIFYTLLFGFFLFILGLAAILTIALGIRDRRAAGNPASGRPVGQLVRAVLGRGLGVVGLAGALMLLVWAPYALAVLRGDHGSNLAARYLPANSAVLPTPMTDISVTGALCLAGLGWIVLNIRRNSTAQALAIGVAAAYVWYLLSNLAIAAGTTLLAFRVEPVLVTMLGIGAALGAVQLLGHVLGRMRRGAAGLSLLSVRPLAMALGLFTAFTLLQQVPPQYQREVNEAYTNYYPTGLDPAGNRDPNDLAAWLPQLTDTISTLTSRQPHQLVLLTDNWTLLSVQPYWSFQASTPHYANPVADFDARRAQIEAWAAAETPAQLVTQLNASTVRAPDVLVLRQQSDGGLHLDLSSDTFPQEPNVGYYNVRFDPALFASSAFTVQVVGPFTVVVRR